MLILVLVLLNGHLSFSNLRSVKFFRGVGCVPCKVAITHLLQTFS